MRARKTSTWYGDLRVRCRFERGAFADHPSLRCSATGRGRDAIITYRLTVDVPYYELRKVRIDMYNWSAPTVKQILVDGPSESPHRYGGNALCVWRPDDPPERKWVADDGLLDLITHTAHHLYFEAHWRRTLAEGEPVWLGDEAPHTPLTPLNRHARRAAR